MLKNKILLPVTVVVFMGHFAASAQEPPVLEVKPQSARILGDQSYEPVTAQKMANPKLIYVDIPRASLTQRLANFLKDRWGWAKPTRSEPKEAYLSFLKKFFPSFYGGTGLNNNLGEGRAAVSDDENFKGIGPTAMLNRFTDPGHDSGTMAGREAIIEAIWSKLMSLELPYGAVRVRGMVATGTIVRDYMNQHPDFRVVFVRDDFLRPGHFMLNPTSPNVGRAEADVQRVQHAIRQLPHALPQPKGSRARNLNDRFVFGIHELIDRMAKQAGYQWAHSIYAAAMSPTNMSLTGAAADFGAYRALNGYPRVQLMDDARANGDCEEIVVLQEFHDALSKNAPKEWAAAMGSIADWEKRFHRVRETEIGKEMLVLSGAFPELMPALENDPASKRLSDLLYRVARAGNEEVIQTWVSPFPYESGTYNLPRVLAKLAQAELTIEALSARLAGEIADQELRANLASAYLEYYKKMNSLAAQNGISESAAQAYRQAAVEIRNKKMNEIFSTPEFFAQVDKVVETYMRDGDETAIAHFIEQKVNASRRNFRDAERFTVVTSQKYDEVSGQVERTVYDARAGRQIQVRYKEVTPMERLMKKKMNACEPDLSVPVPSGTRAA